MQNIREHRQQELILTLVQSFDAGKKTLYNKK